MVRLGIDCDFATEVKPHTPFGQAPFFRHGSLSIGQSGAISRSVKNHWRLHLLNRVVVPSKKGNDRAATPICCAYTVVRVWVKKFAWTRRYISKIGGLSGGSDADFAMSEMLLCEADDMLAILSAAKYRNGNTVSVS